MVNLLLFVIRGGERIASLIDPDEWLSVLTSRVIVQSARTLLDD